MVLQARSRHNADECRESELAPSGHSRGIATICRAAITLVHELLHWSDAKHRCGREVSKRVGDEAYAAEELVAKIGVAFLCAELALPNSSSQTARTIW